MKAHPLSELFPLLDGDDLQALADDIKSHGLREKIVTLDGLVLDGRNRYRACELAGIEPETVVYRGSDPLAYVVSKNLRRRHLSTSQRAMIANRMATLRQGERKADRQNCPSGASQAEAAEALDVSERSVKAARTVQEKGTAAEVAAVDAGEVPVSRAEKEIRRKEKEIRDAAERDPHRFADLAGRLDQPGAKVEAVHKELRKREKAGTKKKDVLLDALEQPVPDHLRDLFASGFLMDSAGAVEEFVRDALPTLVSRLKKTGPRFKFLTLGEVLKTAERVETDLKIIHSLLTEARPHSLCPACKGSCSAKATAAKCEACRHTGYVTRWRLADLKKPRAEA